jgi:hypothetical protein
MRGWCAAGLVALTLLVAVSGARAQSDDNEVGEDGNAYTLVEPDEVHASGVPVITEHEDVCNARLEFHTPRGRTVANITASRLAFKTERKCRIIAEDAYVSIDYAAKSGVVIRRTANATQLAEVREALRAGKDLSSLNYQSLVAVEPLVVERVEDRLAQVFADGEHLRDGHAPAEAVGDSSDHFVVGHGISGVAAREINAFVQPAAVGESDGDVVGDALGIAPVHLRVFDDPKRLDRDYPEAMGKVEWDVARPSDWSTLIPIIGYLIIFNSTLAHYAELISELNGNSHAHSPMSVHPRLFLIYFGLCYVVAGSECAHQSL